MSKKAIEALKTAIHDAEITELDEERLEEVAGGACNESCHNGCSQCCSIGSANRGDGGGGTGPVPS